MLEAIGSDLDPRKVLRYAKRNYDNEDLIEESIELFAKHLSNEFLATLAADIEEIIGEDDLSEDEEAFIDRLVEEWQIEDEYEDEDEEYDEEEESDEEEYSGDDEEYDEDEDGEDDDDGSTGGRG